VAGVLNNSARGSSQGPIINACGGIINDSGELGPVSWAPCVWSGAGGNDKWSNPANWVNGVVPPGEHPVLINGEGSAAAMVLLDFNLVIKARSLTVGAGDTLTIGEVGSGAYGRATLSVEEPGGLLINRGTVAVSNRSSLRRDPLAVFDNKAGIVSFELDGVHAHDIGTILDREGIAVRVGHHCAQPLMDRFNIAGTVRASFGLYTNEADIDALVASLGAVREIFN